ncbi:MAG TPA: hypothetical protein VHK69_20160 [Chitinophagaceae bacterium]|jgi:hypothetical protein|nr:hypothetical protein [Chitinophagaceae bacterium]
MTRKASYNKGHFCGQSSAGDEQAPSRIYFLYPVIKSKQPL